MSHKFAVVVPTLNAEPLWPQWQSAVASQRANPDKILVLDSESTDGTPEAVKMAGYDYVKVKRSSFDHGATRQSALSYISPGTEVVVFLTQDAILASPDALQRIVAAFDDPIVGVAYGRQLPRPVAGIIEAHARLFNYPATSEVRAFEDRDRLGLKAPFCSNSFAAYRVSALSEVGGFPFRAILSEDTVTAARMMKLGWKLAYVADSTVYHSHGYSVAEEFRRYFDIGALHSQEAWLLEDFGEPEGEGMRFVRSEISALGRSVPHLIPLVFVKTIAKYVGYRLGRLERRIPKSIKVQMSMNRGFWRKQASAG